MRGCWTLLVSIITSFSADYIGASCRLIRPLFCVETTSFGESNRVYLSLKSCLISLLTSTISVLTSLLVSLSSPLLDLITVNFSMNWISLQAFASSLWGSVIYYSVVLPSWAAVEACLIKSWTIPSTIRSSWVSYYSICRTVGSIDTLSSNIESIEQ